MSFISPEVMEALCSNEPTASVRISKPNQNYERKVQSVLIMYDYFCS